MMLVPKKPPQVYAEWVELLDTLRERVDDEAVLQALQQGTIAWQCGVSERLIKKLTDTINARMNAAIGKFQKALNSAHGQEGDIVQALLALRKEMDFLSQAINLPAVPEKSRAQCRQLVLAQADSIQTSLEDSAKKDRTGKMLSIVRNHKVNAFKATGRN